jgi:hypothetical protein
MGSNKIYFGQIDFPRLHNDAFPHSHAILTFAITVVPRPSD